MNYPPAKADGFSAPNKDKEPPDPRSHLRQPDPDMSHYMGDTDRT